MLRPNRNFDFLFVLPLDSAGRGNSPLQPEARSILRRYGEGRTMPYIPV